MTINERVTAVVDDISRVHNLTQNAIERKAGLSKVLSNIRNGREPSVITISKLLITFPDYSADWILLERGSMFINGGEIAELRKQNEKLLKLNIQLQEMINKK